MEVIIEENAESGCALVARIIAKLVRAKPSAVLGLATGRTSISVYRELVRLHIEEGLSFRSVVTFNLDEYVGIPPDHPGSYHTFMRENFFSQVDIDRRHIFMPDGNSGDIVAACKAYEAAIATKGGIDLQLLGIGVDGHIGFNEPSSALGSRTRIKTLVDETRRANADAFGGDLSNVPHHVITMGVGTIMDARTCVLLALGRSKASAVARAVEGPVTAMLPASALQFHPDAKIIVDHAAASSLTLKDYYQAVYRGKPDWQRY